MATALSAARGNAETHLQKEAPAAYAASFTNS